MTDGQRVRHMLEVRERLARVLAKAQDKRDAREPWGDDGWIEFERAEMLRAVNAERGPHHPVTMADVVRVETQAVGHSDYVSKFALYCAELVVYGPDRRSP